MLNGLKEFVRDCSTWYIMSLYHAATFMLTISYLFMNGCSCKLSKHNSFYFFVSKYVNTSIGNDSRVFCLPAIFGTLVVFCNLLPNYKQKKNFKNH